MRFCFLVFFFRVLGDCKVFMLCFLDTITPSTQFTLKIPLIVPPTATVATELSTTESAPTTTQVTIPTAVTTKLETENPFTLTDKEIDEMIEILDQGSIGVLSQTSALSTLDEDLKDVLNMDVDSFIV